MHVKSLLVGSVGLLVAQALSASVLVSSGSFTVDRTAPDVPALVAPANGSSLSGAFLQLSVTAQDATSGIGSYEFEINAASAGWQLASVYSMWEPVSDTYQWRCRAVDRAGNESDWSPSFSVDFLADANADSDNDGLTDAWEGRHFGTLDHSDGTIDSDGDGVSDQDELTADTHPYEFLLNLDSGWNLLSLPFDATEDGVSVLRDSIVLGRFQEWDGRRYQDVGLPPAYAGFWVFSFAAQADVPVSGFPADSSYVPVLKGWNVIGPRVEIPLSATGSRRALRWDGRRFRAMRANDLLSPFSGYYVQSSEDKMLNVGDDGQ